MLFEKMNAETTRNTKDANTTALFSQLSVAAVMDFTAGCKARDKRTATVIPKKVVMNLKRSSNNIVNSTALLIKTRGKLSIFN